MHIFPTKTFTHSKSSLVYRFLISRATLSPTSNATLTHASDALKIPSTAVRAFSFLILCVCVDNTPTRVPTDTATADVAIVHAMEDIVADMK
jgi:hypothetical protein